MNRESLLETFFNYLKHCPEQKPGQNVIKFQPQAEEDNLISQLSVSANSSYKSKPDEQIWLKIKESVLKQAEAKRRSLFRFPGKMTVILSLSAVAIVALLLVLFTWQFNQNSGLNQTLYLAQLKSKSEKISVGSHLTAKGIEIHNQSDGNIEFLSESTTGKKYDTIAFHDGNWKISADHTQLDRKIYFAFPGGWLTPVGTAFSVNITGNGSEIVLTKGRIIFRFDKQNEINRELAAPGELSFSGE